MNYGLTIITNRIYSMVLHLKKSLLFPSWGLIAFYFLC